MKKKGFSMLEMVIVVMIIGILSLLATDTLIDFQKNAILDDNAREVASLIRTAYTKSTSGEIEEGKTAADYAPDGLPMYGVKIDNNNYSLYFKEGILGTQKFFPEIYKIENNLIISPATLTVEFYRISGNRVGTSSITISRADGQGSREIKISDNGSVTIVNL